MAMTLEEKQGLAGLFAWVCFSSVEDRVKQARNDVNMTI